MAATYERILVEDTRADGITLSRILECDIQLVPRKKGPMSGRIIECDIQRISRKKESMRGRIREYDIQIDPRNKGPMGGRNRRLRTSVYLQLSESTSGVIFCERWRKYAPAPNALMLILCF